MLNRAVCALIFVLLVSTQSRAETACIDPASLAHSTVGIVRYFDEAERHAQRGLLGIQGTAWFQSPMTLVTAAHVASAMRLSPAEWKVISIEDGADSQSIPVRVQRFAGAYAEKLAVLELRTPVSNARSVAIRTSPLTVRTWILRNSSAATKPQGSSW